MRNQSRVIPVQGAALSPCNTLRNSVYTRISQTSFHTVEAKKNSVPPLNNRPLLPNSALLSLRKSHLVFAEPPLEPTPSLIITIL